MKDAIIGITLGNALRSTVDAMNLKVPEGDLGFLCPECHRPVKPHKDGMQGPHFEHMQRNPECSRSDV
jgi:hypothetical protein